MSETEIKPTAAPTLSFVKLIVTDLEGAVRFYTTAFGLADARRINLPYVEEAVMVSRGSLALVLMQYIDGRPRTAEGREAPIGFRVVDVDASYADSIAAGAEGTRPPYDPGAGMRVAFVKDPWGNEIELVPAN
jgi:predicted enzyme related to lactoylglutathione lyase